jgi:hypothetical protein
MCLLLHMQRIVQYSHLCLWVEILSILRYMLLLIHLVQEIYSVSNMLNLLCFVFVINLFSNSQISSQKGSTSFNIPDCSHSGNYQAEVLSTPKSDFCGCFLQKILITLWIQSHWKHVNQEYKHFISKTVGFIVYSVSYQRYVTWSSMTECVK